jgi:hypothetical protein
MSFRFTSTSITTKLIAALTIMCLHAAAQCTCSCPPYSVPDAPNLLVNPDFEAPTSVAFTSWCHGIGSLDAVAPGWKIHSDNQGSCIYTDMKPSDLPIGGKYRMIHVVAHGGESGIWQMLPPEITNSNPKVKMMASVWVKVISGHVILQPNGGNKGPSSWSTKKNEWELLRVCTDATADVNMFIVYNEQTTGGEFYVDRAEVKVVP